MACCLLISSKLPFFQWHGPKQGGILFAGGIQVISAGLEISPLVSDILQYRRFHFIYLVSKGNEDGIILGCCFSKPFIFYFGIV